MMSCPCGSGVRLEACCGLLHAGKVAITAESLMRSRYSAYVLGLSDYLIKTWHPERCPEEVVCVDTKWLGLTIIRIEAGGLEDDCGLVEFRAVYMHASKAEVLHESSQFKRVNDLWLYHSGTCHVDEIGRNMSCPCGSGLKFKRCCLKNI